MVYSPAFSALSELILSLGARIAPSNKLINSSKMQVQNCGTYSFNITKSPADLPIREMPAAHLKASVPRQAELSLSGLFDDKKALN